MTEPAARPYLAVAVMQFSIEYATTQDDETWVITLHLAEDPSALLETLAHCRQDAERAAVVQISFCEAIADRLEWDDINIHPSEEKVNVLFVVRAYVTLNSAQMFCLSILLEKLPDKLGEGWCTFLQPHWWLWQGMKAAPAPMHWNIGVIEQPPFILPGM